MSVTALPSPVHAAHTDSRRTADALIGFLRGYATHRVNSRLIDERRTIPPSVVLDCGREGLFGLQIERRHGGLQLNHVDTFRVLEQLAAVDPNILLLASVHHAIGTPPIRLFAREELREEVLPLIASGRTLATIAASEPGAGSNLAGISTTAQRTPEGGYLLDGEKSWISLGAWAGYISVFAQLIGEDGEREGMTGFLVKQGTPGFVPGEEALTLGMKGIPQNQIAIRGLRLPPGAVLGEEGRGAQVAQTAFMMGRAVVAISAAGVMKRCLQLCARYARRRHVATGMLFDNGLTQQLLSDSVAATSAVEAVAYAIASRLDRGEEVPAALYMAAKILGAELMWRVVDRSVQMLGARGFMDTNVVGQYFRDMRLLRIFEGPTESMTLYLGSTMLKNEQQSLATLGSQLGMRTERLAHAIALAREGYASESPAGITAQHDWERLCARVGELTAWAIFEGVLAHPTYGDASSLHARSWCSQQFDGVVRQLQAERAELPSGGVLAEEIDAYAERIGFIEQTMAGEARALDRLLRQGEVLTA